MKISPYRTPDGWAFDDAERGIVAEPLILGAHTLCDILADGEEKFTIEFSADPPGEDNITLLQFDSADKESWYYSKTHNIVVYLCPALFAFFEAPPQIIYYTVIPPQVPYYTVVS